MYFKKSHFLFGFLIVNSNCIDLISTQLIMESTLSLCTKTNGEVFDFIKQNENLSRKKIFDAAIVFFGSIPGGEKKLKSDISKLKDENKSRKRKAHRNLMIDCGGGGKKEISPLLNMSQKFFRVKKCVHFAN